MTAIILAIVAIGGALLGAILGHPFSKSSGVKEGQQKQADTQVAQQAQATIQAVQERQHVDKTVSDDSDADLDARLSKHPRPD